MKQRRIVYYECVNPECGLRFPDFRAGMHRECCPMCRNRLEVALEYDTPGVDSMSVDRDVVEPFIECLVDNVRSGLNIGSIFRSADGTGVRKLYLCGITPSPEHPMVKKTALSAEKYILWEQVKNGALKAQQLKEAGCHIWGLESPIYGDSLYSLRKDDVIQAITLVVGNEICGIDPEILKLCDRIVSIPMVGVKGSFNVATAFAIAASYIHHLQMFSQGSESKFPRTRLTP